MTVERKMINVIVAGVILLPVLILAACNSRPGINHIVANPSEVEVGGVVELTVDVVDADGDDLEYTWSATPPAGRFDSATGRSRSVKWTAPKEAGEVLITVSVSDGKHTESDSVSVTVMPSDKKAPQNFAGTGYDQEVRLSWENPQSDHFKRVVIRRSDSAFPDSFNLGISVYEGEDETYTDSGLINGVPYYYSIFAE